MTTTIKSCPTKRFSESFFRLDLTFSLKKKLGLGWISRGGNHKSPSDLLKTGRVAHPRVDGGHPERKDSPPLLTKFKVTALGKSFARQTSLDLFLSFCVFFFFLSRTPYAQKHWVLLVSLIPKSFGPLYDLFIFCLISFCFFFWGISIYLVFDHCS